MRDGGPGLGCESFAEIEKIRKGRWAITIFDFKQNHICSIGGKFKKKKRERNKRRRRNVNLEGGVMEGGAVRLKEGEGQSEQTEVFSPSFGERRSRKGGD